MDPTSSQLRQSLERLKETFEGHYGQTPLFEAGRKIGRISQEGNKIYLTFRGSVDSFLEILSCANVRKISLERWGLAGKVHAGIYHCFSKIQPLIEDFLNCPRSVPKDVEFVIEGYSRGSGIATLVAAYLAKKFANDRLTVLTFSSMNIFDQEAAEAYQRSVKRHWSFLCTSDLFPRWVGPPWLGFYPVGQRREFSAEDSPSFRQRVRARAYTHLIRHWLIAPFARFFIPLRRWEAHMPETYEDGAVRTLISISEFDHAAAEDRAVSSPGR